jgi:hypothetical protein
MMQDCDCSAVVAASDVNYPVSAEEIRFCALHKAAGAMLVALEEIRETFAASSSPERVQTAWAQVSAAIAQAKGEA